MISKRPPSPPPPALYRTCPPASESPPAAGLLTAPRPAPVPGIIGTVSVTACSWNRCSTLTNRIFSSVAFSLPSLAIVSDAWGSRQWGARDLHPVGRWFYQAAQTFGRCSCAVRPRTGCTQTGGAPPSFPATWPRKRAPLLCVCKRGPWVGVPRHSRPRRAWDVPSVWVERLRVGPVLGVDVDHPDVNGAVQTPGGRPRRSSAGAGRIRLSRRRHGGAGSARYFGRR